MLLSGTTRRLPGVLFAARELERDLKIRRHRGDSDIRRRNDRHQNAEPFLRGFRIVGCPRHLLLIGRGHAVEHFRPLPGALPGNKQLKRVVFEQPRRL